jgi:hypothetical protein
MECAMRRLALVFCLVAFTGAACGQAAVPKQQAPQSAKQARAFKEFAQLVQQYVDLRNKVGASLPRLGSKEPQEKIVERQQAFAQKIREARAGAKRGDIFAPEIAEEFRRLIRRELQGPKGPNARKTMRQGDPVKPFRLRVGDTYPETLPATTVPPTLLLKLPQLPEEVAYRIVGRDLVLQDVEANLIVDFVHEALP